MSRELVRTALAGHKGPAEVPTPIRWFQAELEELGGFERPTLLAAAGSLPGGIGRLEAPVTEDGYEWFWGYEFCATHGEMVVLVPWFRDWYRKDCSRADRSVAVYTKGSVGDDEIAELLLDLGSTVVALAKYIRPPRGGIMFLREEFP